VNKAAFVAVIGILAVCALKSPEVFGLPLFLCVAGFIFGIFTHLIDD
jgi:hypothetical protein